MRILIVEDEKRIADSIKKGLEQERFNVDVCYGGQEGYDMAISEQYDAIILDRMLPQLDGMTFCKNLRNADNNTPILMLTAKTQTEDKIAGLNCGADDYLAKPFAFEELTARVRALTRRPRYVDNKVLSVVDLTLDAVTFIVKRNSKTVPLSSREFALLEYLLRNKNRVVTKDQIINNVWEYDSDVLPNTVEVTIRNLRNKLGKPEIITTVRGFGYKIED